MKQLCKIHGEFNYHVAHERFTFKINRTTYMKKLLILPLLLFALFAPAIASAAIARDNNINDVWGSGSSATVPFAIGTGANRILFVTALKQSSQTVTSITYGGIPMTQVESVLGYTFAENLYIYMLVNPPSGTHDIVALYSGAGVNLIYASSYTGAAQTGQPDAHTSQRATSGTSLSTSLNMVADNSWMYGFFRVANSIQTPDSNTSFFAANNDVNQADTNGSLTPTGSYSMGVNSYGDGVAAQMVVSFAPAVAPTAAIAFDNVVQYTSCVTGTSCTYSYTVTGSNTFLACSNLNYNTPAGATSMTYGGVPMTHLGVQQVDSTSPDTSTMDTFYLAGAATGTHDIVITTANNMTNGFYAHCASYTGVDQLSPVSTFTQHIKPYATINSDSALINTLYNNEWVVGFWGDHAGRAYTPGSGTTQRITDSQGAVEDSGGPVPTPASKIITVNMNGFTGVSLTAFGLKPMTTLPIVPSAPTLLEVNRATNPTDVHTPKPQFTAIFQSASSTALAASYEIQVMFGSYVYWDSGRQAYTKATPVGVRTKHVLFDSLISRDGATYTWRIKFWDQYGNEGEWSTENASFIMHLK